LGNKQQPSVSWPGMRYAKNLLKHGRAKSFSAAILQLKCQRNVNYF
jgi:hypothetical protein